MVASQKRHSSHSKRDVRNRTFTNDTDTADSDTDSVVAVDRSAPADSDATQADRANDATRLCMASDAVENGTSKIAAAATRYADINNGDVDGFHKPKNKDPVPFTWPQRWLIVCLSISSVLDGFCQAIYIPFFPGEAHKRGLSLAESGAIFTVFAVSEMLAYPLMGWLAPRLGIRRLYLAGLVTAGVATLTFGLMAFTSQPLDFLVGCVVVRAVESLGTAAILTGARTIIFNQFAGRVNTVIGVIEAVKAAGLCVGPALGGGLYALGGYSMPFYTLGGLLIITAAVNIVVMPAMLEADSEEPKRQDGDENVTDGGSRHSYLKLVGQVFSCPNNWLIFMMMFIPSMHWWALDPCLPPYVEEELGVNPTELGLFYLASFTAFAVASPVWSRLADSIHNSYLLVAACMVPAAVGTLLLPPAPPLTLAPSRLLLGTGMVIREAFALGVYLPLMAMLLRSSVAHGLPDDVHGQALVSAVFGAVYNVGRAAWPLVGAAVIQELSLPLLATCMAGITLAMAAVVAVRGLLYARQSQTQKQRQQMSPEMKQ